jgi:YihY family inner membrane protein
MARSTLHIIESLRRANRYVMHDIWQAGLPGEKRHSGLFVKNLRVAFLLTKGITEETLLLRASALTFATMLFIVPFMVFMFAAIQTFDLGDAIYLKVSTEVNRRVEQVARLLPFDDEDEEKQEEEANKDQKAEPELPPEVARFDVFGLPGEREREPEPEPVVEATPEAQLMAAVAEAATAASQPAPPQQPREEKQRQAFLHALITFLFPHFEVPKEDGKQYLDPVQILVQMVEDSGATSLSTLGVTGLVWVLITVFGFMRNVEWTFNRIWGVKTSRSYLRSLVDYIAITVVLPFMATVVLGITAALATQDTSDGFRLLLRGSQLGLVSLTFTLLYKVVPNTKVQFRYALLGGVIAGATWMMMSWGFVTFQVGLARNVFFFSTFALFPVLLFWIYCSWVILLYGALLSFAYQNERTFAMEQYTDQASYAYKEAVAVRAVVEMTRRFRKGQPPLSVQEMGEEWNVPVRLLNELMDELTEAGLISPTGTEPVRYQPGRAPDTMQVSDVVRVVREAGMDCSALRRERIYRPLYRGLNEGDNHYLDMTIAAMAERLDRKEDREEQKPEGRMISYPGGM